MELFAWYGAVSGLIYLQKVSGVAGNMIMLLIMAGDIHLNPGPGITSAKVKDYVKAAYPCTVCSSNLEKMTKEFCVTGMTVGHMLSVVISMILNIMINYLHNLIVKFGCTHHVPPPVLLQLMIRCDFGRQMPNLKSPNRGLAHSSYS